MCVCVCTRTNCDSKCVRVCFFAKYVLSYQVRGQGGLWELQHVPASESVSLKSTLGGPLAAHACEGVMTKKVHAPRKVRSPTQMRRPNRVRANSKFLARLLRVHAGEMCVGATGARELKVRGQKRVRPGEWVDASVGDVVLSFRTHMDEVCDTLNGSCDMYE